MNVEIGAKAVLFQEKEYISGIFVAVYKESTQKKLNLCRSQLSEDQVKKLSLFIILKRTVETAPSNLMSA